MSTLLHNMSETSIPCTKELRNELRDCGKKGDSWEKVLRGVLEDAKAYRALKELNGAKGEPKPLNMSVLIEELKDFDYSDHEGSIKKLKSRLESMGYNTEGLREALLK